jgi:hypothetical protein
MRGVASLGTRRAMAWKRGKASRRGNAR